MVKKNCPTKKGDKAFNGDQKQQIGWWLIRHMYQRIGPNTLTTLDIGWLGHHVKGI